MEMDGLDCAKCQKSTKRDISGINGKFKSQIVSSSSFERQNG